MVMAGYIHCNYIIDEVLLSCAIEGGSCYWAVLKWGVTIFGDG